MDKKKLPTRINDFKTIIENDYYFADKSMLINELLNKKSEVTLLSRPRKFGKTLNMSMLNYFFNIEDRELNRNLFNDLNISNTDKMIYQGEYPVICMSLKDIKVNNLGLCLEKFIGLIKKEYKKYGLILEEKRDAQENSLLNLSEHLYEKYGKKVIILIDEYDTPSVTSHSQGYHDEAILFFRNFLSAALKGNPYLEFAVLTGDIDLHDILPNNISLSTILDKNYNYFGFNLKEVNEILKILGKSYNLYEIVAKCGGYKIQNEILFNPSLLFKFLINDMEELLIDLENSFNYIVGKSDTNIRKKLLELRQFGKVEECVEKIIICPDMKFLNIKLYSLLFSGYLTYHSFKVSEITGMRSYILTIPNEKIEFIIDKYLKENYSEKRIDIC